MLVNIYLWLSPKDYVEPKPYIIYMYIYVTEHSEKNTGPSWLRPSWPRAELTQGPTWLQAELTRYPLFPIKMIDKLELT